MMAKEYSSDHWSGIPERGTDGKLIAPEVRERLRLDVAPWPEAAALGRKTELLEVDVWQLARSFRATHPDTWREDFLKHLADRAEHKEAYRPSFTGALIGQAHEKLERMISEVHPDHQLAALQELVAFLEKRKGAKKDQYR